MEKETNQEPSKKTSQDDDIYQTIYGDDYRRKKLKNKELEKKLEITRRKVEELTKEKVKRKKLIERVKELQGRQRKQPKPNSRPLPLKQQQMQTPQRPNDNTR